MLGDERPRFHLTPPSNWMNDPNGLVFRDGVLHCFYQYNPDEPRWGRIHWGHATTTDLVTWHHQPVALAPGDSGPDSLGCWSGCVVDADGVATMFYTGVMLDGETRRATICRATGDKALTTWSKDDSGPCVAEPPLGIAADAFRDPFVFRDDRGWSMLVGAGSTSGLATVLLYRSQDLRAWDYIGPFLSSDEIARTDGADGPCWECPQLLDLGGMAVLIVSVVDRTPGIRPSHVAAFVGRVVDDRFVVEHTEELGMGPDFYAPATAVTPDGRKLLFGWVPEDPAHDPAIRDWTGSLTFPRIVSIGPDGRLSLTLAHEVAALRADRRPPVDILVGEGRPSWHYTSDGQHFEIEATIDPGDAAEVTIELAGHVEAEDPEVRIVFQPHGRILTVGRRGIVQVAGRSAHNARTIPGTDGDPLYIRLIVDGSVVEMEADHRVMATMRRSSGQLDQLTVSVAAIGGQASLRELTTWSLRASGSFP